MRTLYNMQRAAGLNKESPSPHPYKLQPQQFSKQAFERVLAWPVISSEAELKNLSNLISSNGIQMALKW